MSARRETPADEITGLPLPIWPNSEISNGPTGWDLHHHFHPKKDELLKNDIENSNPSGSFLRHSRLQYVPRNLHNAYHKIYKGPELNIDEHERYLKGILSLAGYMPKQAIDVTKSAKKDFIKNIDDITYRQMISPDYLRQEIIEDEHRARRIGKFMMEIVLGQDIGVIKELELEEFVETKEAKTKLVLCRSIINTLIEESTEPIEPIYRKAYRKGMLANTHLRRPRGIILKITAPYHQEYIETLEDKVRGALAA